MINPTFIEIYSEIIDYAINTANISLKTFTLDIASINQCAHDFF